MAFHLFGNYSKPGPGVSKDEPQKPAFFRFWTIFFRKWTKFAELNLIFILPVALAVALFFCINRFSTLVWVCAIPVVILFPFWGGLTFVTRNYAREEHAFVWSDFKDAVKENWKKLLVNGLITYAITVVLSYTVPFYGSAVSNGGSWFFYIPLAICIAIGTLFLFAQYYIPLMIVTFDLKLKQIYKNGFIFAIVGLWRNLLLTVILAVWIFLHVIAFLLVGWPLLVEILLLLFLDFSLVCFLINFTVYPLIEKMMIKPYYDKQNAAAEGTETKEQPALEKKEEFEDSGYEGEEDKSEPEYVFVNGKLVKRTQMADGEEEQVFEDRL